MLEEQIKQKRKDEWFRCWLPVYCRWRFLLSFVCVFLRVQRRSQHPLIPPGMLPEARVPTAAGAPTASPPTAPQATPPPSGYGTTVPACACGSLSELLSRRPVRPLRRTGPLSIPATRLPSAESLQFALFSSRQVWYTEQDILKMCSYGQI